jgi:hypothetical protein
MEKSRFGAKRREIPQAWYIRRLYLETKSTYLLIIKTVDFVSDDNLLPIPAESVTTKLIVVIQM